MYRQARVNVGSARFNKWSGGIQDKRRKLIESVSELESLSVMTSTLEEVGERVSTWEPSALERLTALLSHRIVRVVSVVEPLS